MINTISAIEREIFKKRGFSTDEEMLGFLNMTPDMLPVFSSLVDGDRVLDGLNEAVDSGAYITIYGDYDADGVMAMTILYKGLEQLSPGKINWFANDRFRDGYSITEDSLEHLLESFPATRVIISCDNGIGAVEAWNRARELGIKVYVTDHHEQGADRVPDPSIPAVCEKSIKQKEAYAAGKQKAEGFCGAELARRLIMQLYEMKGISANSRDFLESLCAYAGVATITDVIQLNASNHCIARAAIDHIRQDKGFWKIFHENITGGKALQSRIDDDTFGFYYGPAINACSRVRGSVDLPMRVFLSDEGDPGLPGLIRQMAEINETRKSLTEEDARKCEQIIKAHGYEEDPFILIADEGLKEGINGLTAGRLKEEYGVPVIVLGKSGNPGIFKGSARSTDSINIYEKLTECSDLLVAFGGHPKAAGLSIRDENLDEFRRRMTESVSKDYVREEMSADDSDFVLAPSKFTEANIIKLREAYEHLLPFGEGFAKPGFFIEEEVNPNRGIMYMNEGVHAKLRLTARSSDNKEVVILMWNRGSYIKDIEADKGEQKLMIRGMVNLPEINRYNGIVSFQMTSGKTECLYKS